MDYTIKERNEALRRYYQCNDVALWIKDLNIDHITMVYYHNLMQLSASILKEFNLTDEEIRSGNVQ